MRILAWLVGLIIVTLVIVACPSKKTPNIPGGAPKPDTISVNGPLLDYLELRYSQVWSVTQDTAFKANSITMPSDLPAELAWVGDLYAPESHLPTWIPLKHEPGSSAVTLYGVFAGSSQDFEKVVFNSATAGGWQTSQKDFAHEKGDEIKLDSGKIVVDDWGYTYTTQQGVMLTISSVGSRAFAGLTIVRVFAVKHN